MKPGITAKDLPKIWLFLLLSCCSHGFFQRLLRCPPGCRCHPEGQIICQNIWLDGPLNRYYFRFVRNASVQLALHMDHNEITHIPRRVFQKFSSLRNLSLSDNCISTLDPEAFFGLRQLRFLDMRNNSITELPINLFEQLVWLVSLDLRQNSIAQVLPETIAPLVSLEQLALGDNPLVCDCQIKETLLWVSSRNVSEGDPPITCILPGVIPRTPWRYLVHMCPGVYRKRASTTTISTSLITSTMSSSETQSCKSATTSSIYEETILITNDSHYNPTLASIMHKVSATPRVEGIANRTASANTGESQGIAMVVVVTTALAILSVFVFIMCRRKQKRTRLKVMQDENAPSLPPPGRGQELLCENDAEDEEEGYEYVDLGKNSDTARYVSLNQENGVSKY